MRISDLWFMEIGGKSTDRQNRGKKMENQISEVVWTVRFK